VSTRVKVWIPSSGQRLGPLDVSRPEVVAGKVRIQIAVILAGFDRLANTTIRHDTDFSPDPVFPGIAVGETIKAI